MSPHTPPAELISGAMRFRMHNAGNFSRKVVVVVVEVEGEGV